MLSHDCELNKLRDSFIKGMKFQNKIFLIMFQNSPHQNSENSHQTRISNKYLALLSLCTVSGKENTSSSASKLIKHELWTFLPRVMEPTYMDKVRKQINLKYCDLFILNIGKYVHHHDGKTWSKGCKVIKQCDLPRSYLNSKWPKSPSQQTFVSYLTITEAQNFLLSRTSKQITPKDPRTPTSCN